MWEGKAGMGRAVVGLMGRDDWGGVGGVVGVVRVVCGFGYEVEVL